MYWETELVSITRPFNLYLQHPTHLFTITLTAVWTQRCFYIGTLFHHAISLFQGNKGAFITFQPDSAQTGLNKLTPCYTTYDAVPHPNVKPMAYANSLLSQFML